jgi:ABC-type transport system involved in multi-copper enzyme maturation permease subunit
MFKIWTIAWRELYIRFTDRNLILIMIATPLAIATIVGLAFGGLGGDDVPIQEIPIAIINHDQGDASGLNYGQVYLSLLVPGDAEEGAPGSTLPECNLEGASSNQPDNQNAISLFELTEAVEFDQSEVQSLINDGQLDQLNLKPDEMEYLDAAAKAAVDNGIYSAAIIIPAEFSATISGLTRVSTPLPQPNTSPEETSIFLYTNSGRPISAGIVSSIVEGITNQIMTGNITIAATFGELASTFGPASLGQLANINIAEAFACAFSPTSNTLNLDIETIQAEETRSTASIILVSVGSSQAMFFALFTAQFGVLSMHNERRQWTLQRLIMSPTPRTHILTGKLIGVFLSVLFQLLLLMIALTLVGSILQRTFSLIWGDDIIRIALVLIAASLAVSGMGMLIAGIAKSPEQGQVFGTVVNMAMAVLGGAFGFQLPRQISALSILYWGRDAFDTLAAGQGEIGLNVLILAIQGTIMYLMGVYLFNRRFEM